MAQAEAAAREAAWISGFPEVALPMAGPADVYVESLGIPEDLHHVDGQVMRADGVPGMVAAFLHDDVPFFKGSWLGPLWRGEREEVHFGLAAFGSDDAALDVEAIALLLGLLKKLEMAPLRLELSTLGCRLCRPIYDEMLREFLDAAPEACDQCTGQRAGNLLRILTCQQRSCQSRLSIAPTIYVTLCPECRSHFSRVQDDLDAIGIDFYVNPGLVPEGSHHTRTVFRIFAAGVPVAEGGRCNNVVADLGGPPTPGIAGDLNLSACAALVEGDAPERVSTDILLLPLSADADRIVLKTMFYLRSRGVRADRGYLGRSVRAHQRYAAQLGARYLVVIGDDERTPNQASVRDLRQHTQETLSLSRLGDNLLQLLRTRSARREPDSRLRSAR